MTYCLHPPIGAQSAAHQRHHFEEDKRRDDRDCRPPGCTERLTPSI
jgi:hypothetical protein